MRHPSSCRRALPPRPRALRAPRPHSFHLWQHALGSSEELLAWLEARNDALASRTARDLEEVAASRTRSSGAAEKALGKAREHGLFLGLSWAWLHSDK